MKPCEPYLYEFLWRGRAPGDDTPAAWHVAIETRVAVGGGGGHVVPHVRTLNVSQAKDEGWDLKKIAAAIDTEVLAEAEQLRARTAALEAQLETAAAAAENAKSEVKDHQLQNEQLQIALRDRAEAADSLAHDRDLAHREIRRLVEVVEEQAAIVKDLYARQPKPAPVRRNARR